MIVAFQPGGNIKDARVVLKHDELLPVKYNTPEAIVFREAEDNPRDWLLVKPRHSTLPADSPALAQPLMPEPEFSLTIVDNSDSLYEHVDIIRFGEETE
jgi:hypothetical protein